MSNTAPTLQRTWQFDLNKPITGTTNQPGGADDAPAWRRQLLMEIKEALIGFATLPWTVQQSNGYNGGLNLAGDNWGTDIGEIRWADNRTFQRSWIVLRNVTLGIEICLDCYNQNNRDGALMDVFVAPVASPFGSAAAGTTTTRPTSAAEDEILNGDNTSNFGSWGSGPETPTPAQSFVLNVWHSTDGLATRVVILLNNVAVGFWQFEEITNQVGAMTYPWIARIRIPEVFATTNQIRVNWLMEASVSAGKRNDGADINYYLASPANDYYIDAFAQETSIKNPYDARWALSPIGVASEDAGWDGFFGTIDDMWFATSGFIGKGYPASTNALVQFGEVVFPWDGSIPLTN